jgi:hypothetical protein
MAKRGKKKRHAAKKRDLVAYAAIVHMKGGPMRDRRERRAKEKKDDWKKELEDV